MTKIEEQEQQFLNDLEKKLWNSADKLRSNLDAAVYKHVVLGLVFLKYVSNSFDQRREELKTDFTNPDHQDYLEGDEDLLLEELEDRDAYTEANVFWVPEAARWSNLQDSAKLALGSSLSWGGEFKGVGKLLDDAMEAIEKDNPKLKNILNKDYGRLQLDSDKLAQLIDLIATIPFDHNSISSKDILGHVYEFFLGGFASAEGKRGGQFYTPKSIVTTITECLEPYNGRVYDPACGSGGFFISSEKFIEEHGGKIGQVSIYGQESNPTTWRLAAMSMVIRGIEFNLGKEPADTLNNDQHPDLRADFIMANPPFNQSEWGGSDDDKRWTQGIPPKGNANFAWIQHMLYHLNQNGSMSLLLANGSMSSSTNNEGEIRKSLIEDDLIECMVSLPSQLFTNTTIPACIWFLTKNKEEKKGKRNRQGETLFINASNLGYMKNRSLKDFSTDDIQKISNTFHTWQQGGNYQDEPGFCFSAKLENIRKYNYVLTPGSYIDKIENNVPIKTNIDRLINILDEELSEARKLDNDFIVRMKSDTNINNKINNIREKIAQSIFKSWFVDFDPVKAKVESDDIDVIAKELGLSKEILSIFPSELEESELGLIPKGWNVKSLDKIANYKNGLALQKFRPENENDFLPVVKIAQLKKGYSDGKEKASPNITPECIIDNGDVVFSWSGSLIVDIWYGGRAALNQHLFKVTSNDYHKWFYYFYTKHYLEQFQQIASDKAVTMGHIKREHLTQALCAVPSKIFLEKISNIFEDYIQNIIKHSLPNKVT